MQLDKDPLSFSKKCGEGEGFCKNFETTIKNSDLYTYETSATGLVSGYVTSDKLNESLKTKDGDYSTFAVMDSEYRRDEQCGKSNEGKSCHCGKTRGNSSEFKSDLRSVLGALEKFLQVKNAKYGNSALAPLQVFSKSSSEDGILKRMDDKLSRIKNSEVLRKNDIVDLTGYLVILCINNGWTNFDDLID